MTLKAERRLTWSAAGCFAVLLFAMTPLSHAQVAVTAGPTVPALWVLGPVIAALIAILVWAVRTISTNNTTLAVVQVRLADGDGEIAALRKWKHDDVEQWRQQITLDVGVLKSKMEHLEQR